MIRSIQQVRWRRFYLAAAWCMVALTAAGYLWFVRKNCAPYASNADASCYLNTARYLLDGRFTVPIRQIDGLTAPAWSDDFLLPLDFRPAGQPGQMCTIGSVGYPLHLMLASVFVGLDWSVVMVNVAAAGAGALLMILLGRRLGLPSGWALGGVALLWACPVFVYMELQPMTDITGMVWCMAVILGALLAREHWAWALAAGAAMSVAVLVRQPNLVLILPVACIIGLRWRAWLALIAGGLPGAVFLVWFNLRTYNAVLTSGYGDISGAFGPQFIRDNALYIATNVPLHLSPLVVLAALGLPWLGRRMTLTVTLLAVWVAAFIGFYLFCYYTSLAWSIRYMMPIFPALILAALLVTRQLCTRLPHAALRAGLPLLLLAGALAWQVKAGERLHVVIMKRGEIIYVQSAEWLRRNAPANAIVLANQVSGAFYYYTDFTLVRIELTPPADLRRLYEHARAAGRPVYAAVYDPESEKVFGRHLRGKWEPLARYGAVVIFKLVELPADGS